MTGRPPCAASNPGACARPPVARWQALRPVRRAGSLGSLGDTMNGYLSSMLLAFLFLMHGHAANAPETRLPKRLHAEFQKLFERYYPKATVRTNDLAVVFDDNTQLFTVPRAGKAGSLPPVEQLGPKRGGILCDVDYRLGKYGGQLHVGTNGTVVDFPKFKLIVMAPHSPRLNTHLYIHLYYPPDTDERFLSEFRRLATEFDRYVD